MKILINVLGSHGDMLPFIALGKAFQRRGHQPHIVGNGSFEQLAREAGLAFTASSSAQEQAEYLSRADVTDSKKGLVMMAERMMRYLASTHLLLSREVEAGNTLVVGSSLAWAARLLSETHRIPGAAVHLSPSWFRSEYVAPCIGPLGHLEGAPRFVKRWIWNAMDRRFLDPLFTDPFNRIRAGLGLPAVQRTYHQWIHQADLTLGMFPEWFAPRQPDWPAGLQLTGFPLYDHGGDAPLPSDVEAFLAGGDAPVAFTTGTANTASHAFFATSAQACELSARRGILITQDARQLPDRLPSGVAHFKYVPFKALLPRLAAFVHHGGIGSTSQALLAGVPQLIRPMAFDQFDNASRCVRMGVASQLMPRRYQPHSAARALDLLISNSALKQRCKQVAQRMSGINGIDATCNAILQLAPQRDGTPIAPVEQAGPPSRT